MSSIYPCVCYSNVMVIFYLFLFAYSLHIRTIKLVIDREIFTIILYRHYLIDTFSPSVYDFIDI